MGFLNWLQNRKTAGSIDFVVCTIGDGSIITTVFQTVVNEDEIPNINIAFTTLLELASASRCIDIDLTLPSPPPQRYTAYLCP